ncbi:hypothetical protein E2562_009128 [Oryza meyeriana var. granulata]|uniref:Uncharacterized protein n=1 Tax=Oryza meyeriana var. granulata TaxID=110450 RepID=A0A6G1D0B5_9ORYZ|nr:hypothetical protein E2562_009128 [Oryza meyeriana var. granulata]
MGLELELLSSHLPPIRTAAATAEDYGGGGAEDVGAVRHEEVPCSTPTAAANVLRAPSMRSSRDNE